MRLKFVLLILVLLWLAGCSGGAVVFAPPPAPPDESPLLFEHPGGVFSVRVPRRWSAAVQNTTTLAAAAFSPPEAVEPVVRFAVMNMGETLDSAALGDLINQYQTTLRPNAASYTESNRQAMGDGSWRLTGLQRNSGGWMQPVNTFIEATGSLVGVIEVILPTDTTQLKELQTIVNSFEIKSGAALEPAKPAILAASSGYGLDFVNVSTWTSANGSFYITGEVANTSANWLAQVPVKAILRGIDQLPVAETADVVLGHGLPPGGFAPFSLRFGGGQPALAVGYDLILGGENWQPVSDPTIYGPETLEWTDESTTSPSGQLAIMGTVTNTGDQPVNSVRAIVTVFDAAQKVIAAGQGDIMANLAPGAATNFQITLPETGGAASSYILNIQGQP
ncbi:MAG TPA: FxLYD domain-containing protein [Phototrophicaceae bacterium]|nr:FxLYD domain-containing protein [Phototrophicaceae bacterium]